MNIGILDWHNKTDFERAFWAGHFKRFPFGDSFTHFLLAQICALVANAVGAKKRPEGAPPEKPDPLALDMFAFAPWLKGSAFDTAPEWSVDDENRFQAGQVLQVLGLKIQEKTDAT